MYISKERLVSILEKLPAEEQSIVVAELLEDKLIEDTSALKLKTAKAKAGVAGGVNKAKSALSGFIKRLPKVSITVEKPVTDETEAKE